MNPSKFKYIFVGILFTLLGSILSPIIFHSTQSDFFLQADSKRDVSPARQQAISLEQAFQEVFDSVSPSVVSIATERTVKIKNSPFKIFIPPGVPLCIT